MKILRRLVGYTYLISVSIISAWTIANVGYYETRWIEDDLIVFFIKRQPTYKVAFINVYQSDHEDNWKGHLEKKERQYAVEFCKYYVGFETEMTTMDDFNECERRYRVQTQREPS
ncbi:hypothetical protein [Pseudomonas sp. NPDC090201]|uniref:hypothetical protein n=1 Tax=Pseudomonas sp. NPDC090201 TaxID=3364475 RepID=UPI0037FCA940